MAGDRTVHAGWILILFAIGVVLAMWGGFTEAQEGDAEVRVVHAGYGIGPVDVYIDGDLAIEALEYADATEYLALAAGEYNVQVTETGGDPAEAVIDATLMLAAGIPHTVVAIGPADLADIIVIIDDHTAPAAGMARLSLVNATTDSFSIGLARADGTVLIEDVQFADASEYIEVEAGAHDFVVTSVHIQGAIATISGFSAEPGATYSVFTLGVDGEYQAEAFVDAVDSIPEPTETPSNASPGSTPAASATAITTAVSQTATPTSSTPPPAATATGMPSLPATGEGGSADSARGAGWLLVVVPVALLAGAAVWRFGNVYPGGRA